MRAVAALFGLALLIGACGAGSAGSPPSLTGAAAPASAAPTSTPGGTVAGGNANATTAGSTALGEQRSDGGGVEVVATWSSMDPPSLKLTLDTHSVDLDRFDLATVATLRLDGGDWAAPTRADVPKGGHHRSGTLTFGTVSSTAFSSARLIELHIADVGLAERLLLWQRR